MYIVLYMAGPVFTLAPELVLQCTMLNRVTILEVVLCHEQLNRWCRIVIVIV